VDLNIGTRFVDPPFLIFFFNSSLLWDRFHYKQCWKTSNITKNSIRDRYKPISKNTKTLDPIIEAFEWTVKWVTCFREWQTFEVARKVGASFRDQLECVRGSKTDTQNKRYFSLKASVAVSIIWLQNGYFCQPQKHELKKWSWIWKFHNALYSISKLRITCFLKEIQCKNITEIQIAMLKSKMFANYCCKNINEQKSCTNIIPFFK
jgi:hypothetical protein